MSKYISTILINVTNYEKFKAICKENKFTIVNAKYHRKDDWYKEDSYEIEIITPLKIWIIKLLKEYNIYQGITFQGINKKDNGLEFILNN